MMVMMVGVGAVVAVVKGVMCGTVKRSLGVLGWGERWGLSERDPLLLR